MNSHSLQGIIRPADISDAPRLYDIRRAAILTLGPTGMSSEQARRWAEAWKPDRAEQVVKNREVWVFQLDDLVMGWVGVLVDGVDGLYTDPAYAHRGIGSRLLAFAEAELARRGYAEVRLEASWNAEAFYVRRGYEATGPRPTDAARPMRKRLAPGSSNGIRDER